MINSEMRKVQTIPGRGNTDRTRYSVEATAYSLRQDSYNDTAASFIQRETQMLTKLMRMPRHIWNGLNNLEE